MNADALAIYDDACRAVSSLRTLHDAKQFRDKAEALRVYARQAKNRQLELDAAEIRIRSEHRLGELLAEETNAGRIGKGRPKKCSEKEHFTGETTLAALGVDDRKLSSRAQKLAALGQDKFSALLAEWRTDAEAKSGRVALDIAKRARKSDRAEARGDEAVEAGSYAESFAAYVSSGKKWGCIYADPPWLYDNQGTRAATKNHYNGLTVQQLCELPVKDLVADDAHLHLWTTNAFLFETPKIFEAWGFEFRSSFAWVKSQIGIGNYWRNSHEVLLTAIRGNAKRFNDKSLKSWIECDRGAHSAKPEIVRSFVERASTGPYLELFGRSRMTGWDVWGNQVSDNLFTQDIPKVA